MAARRPLVNVSGVISELPTGDTFAGAESTPLKSALSSTDRLLGVDGTTGEIVRTPPKMLLNTRGYPVGSWRSMASSDGNASGMNDSYLNATWELGIAFKFDETFKFDKVGVYVKTADATETWHIAAYLCNSYGTGSLVGGPLIGDLADIPLSSTGAVEVACKTGTVTIPEGSVVMFTWISTTTSTRNGRLGASGQTALLQGDGVDANANNTSVLTSVIQNPNGHSGRSMCYRHFGATYPFDSVLPAPAGGWVNAATYPAFALRTAA